MKIRLLFFFILTFLLGFIYAQNNNLQQSFQLKWKSTQNSIDFQEAVFPIEFAGLPVFSYSTVLGRNIDFDVRLTNEIYTTLSNSQLSEKQLNLIQPSIIINKEIGIERKNSIATVSIFPFRRNSGVIEVLQSFEIQITPKQTTNARFGINDYTERNYAAHSILKDGKWYLFGVPKAGIYKLDYAFLKNLGMQVDAINPQNLRIFGHRAGMLPELAGAEREDDALEIPIKVISANNTQFKSGDYILAYLPGPEKWTYQASTQTFKATKNSYSNTKNFFITADAGAGARISSTASSTLPITNTINTYNDLNFIEEDKTNLAMSGRLFLGDEFGGISTKSYNFNFPNLISSQPIKINIGLVGSSNTNGSIFTITSDGGNNSQSIFISSNQSQQGISNTGVYAERLFSMNNLNSNFNIQLNFDRNGDYNTKGWLDFIQVNAISTLRYNGEPILFRNSTTVGAGNITEFTIQNMNATLEIWDITNPFDIKNINYTLSGSSANFRIATDSLKEFAIIDNSGATPVSIGTVANQDLHGLPQQDMLIITRNAYQSYANELAQFHSTHQNLQTAVVDLNQIYNEFSSGTNDITAVRNFVKMFYDRAAGDPNQTPKYLLLFGDGTYDNKNLGDYLLPTYESLKTLETLETYVSDDYFGLLDDNEGANITNTAAEKLDIAVGRIPVDDVAKAQISINKIKMYTSKEAYGDWQNQGTFIADDEDYNIHMSDANEIADNFITQNKKMNIDKIFLDAFQQQSGASGATYPSVNDAINKKIYTGSLFFNYVGHGGPQGLAQERILTFDNINQWSNTNKLPLFITATCEFAPYDFHDQYTAGERVLFKENGGGIGLVTTTRIVYSNRNKVMNENFMTQLGNAATNWEMTLGDITRLAKNASNTYDGNRKFTLLGDPALRLAFPKYNAVVTKINNVPISAPHDTLKALAKITIDGEIKDFNSNVMTDYNDITHITIYDKIKSINTLQNDPGSPNFNFDLQKNTIYKGKTKTTNGKFSFTFLVPKDIDYNFGLGKISLYSNSDTTDAAGYTTDVIIGGAYDTTITDNKGPEVDVFMNDDKFAFGGITDENPFLFCKLFDENGINTSGNGVGHDITAVIDNDTRNIYTLNDFYETAVDDISNGIVNYPFSKLNKGRHTLEVKAWDVLNNSGVGYTEFLVEEKANIALSHVLNYPNPFTTNTKFMFEHNRPGASLDLKIEIFSVTGKVIKTIIKNINSPGYRVDDISWDGLDEYGDKIGRGVYIYRISLKDENGKKVSQYQKLVILN